MARAKAEAQIAITRRHIEYELKNTHNRDREELSMLDRSSDPRQVAVIRARMDQYSDALIAIEEGRLRITTDDSVNTFLNRLSERLREAEKEKVTVLQGAA
jgi:hypothetical protein